MILREHLESIGARELIPIPGSCLYMCAIGAILNGIVSIFMPTPAGME